MKTLTSILFLFLCSIVSARAILTPTNENVYFNWEAEHDNGRIALTLYNAVKINFGTTITMLHSEDANQRYFYQMDEGECGIYHFTVSSDGKINTFIGIWIVKPFISGFGVSGIILTGAKNPEDLILQHDKSRMYDTNIPMVFHLRLIQNSEYGLFISWSEFDYNRLINHVFTESENAIAENNNNFPTSHDADDSLLPGGGVDATNKGELGDKSKEKQLTAEPKTEPDNKVIILRRVEL